MSWVAGRSLGGGGWGQVWRWATRRFPVLFTAYLGCSGLPGQPQGPALPEPSHTQRASQGPCQEALRTPRCFPAEAIRTSLRCPSFSREAEVSVRSLRKGLPQPSNLVGFLGEPPPTCPSILGTDRSCPLGLDPWTGQGQPHNGVSFLSPTAPSTGPAPRMFEQ